MARIKTGGRQKGVLNRTTAETKEILKKIVDKELDGISALLKELEPKDRIDLVIRLLPYIMPKQRELSFENNLAPVILNLGSGINPDEENN